MADRFYFTETPDGVMILDIESNNSCHVIGDYLEQWETDEGRKMVLTYLRNLLLDSWRVGLDNLALTVGIAHD